MKLHGKKPQRKFRANAAVRPASSQPNAIEEEEEEPTMKLSNAFIVVLLLHLVAVGGIYAFNSLKAHHTSAVASIRSDAPAATPDAAVQTAAAPEVQSTPAAPAVQAVPVRTQAIVAPSPAAVAAVPKSATPVKGTIVKGSTAVGLLPKDSGVVHVVVKHENPVTIAKHFGVSQEDLLKLNHIEDPRKLQIGAKLHIPVKVPRTASN